MTFCSTSHLASDKCTVTCVDVNQVCCNTATVREVCSWLSILECLFLWPVSCEHSLCLTMVRLKSTWFPVGNYIRRNKSHYVLIHKFCWQYWICLYPAYWFVCPLPLGRDIDQSICWHQKIFKTLKHVSNYVHKSHFHWLSQETSASKASFCRSSNLCDYLWENLKQEFCRNNPCILETYGLKFRMIF
jgi:hypothetical protein